MSLRFPFEARVFLEWRNEETKINIVSHLTTGDVLEQICQENSQDPIQFSIKCLTETGKVMNLGLEMTFSEVAREYGKHSTTKLLIKKEKNTIPGSTVLQNKIHQLRKANPGSIRIKDLKHAQTFFDTDSVNVVPKKMENFRHLRRFSEPANLATYVHTPINPLILPDRPKDMKPYYDPLMRKARSFSFSENRSGSILRKKKLTTKSSQLSSGKTSVSPIYLLCVKLPNKTHVTLQVTADTALEDVMAQVTKKKGFLLQQEQSPEKYSFEIPGNENKPFQVEMDRTLGFYQSPKVLTLVPVEKQYSTMYMNEHGKDVMILKFVNGKFEVMAATKEKCIERITDEEKTDKPFREIFLLTFRSFMTPEEFLDNLISRYHCVPPENPSEEDLKYFEKGQKLVRENVFYVIKEWCKWYYHDFALNEELRNHLRDFVNEIIHDSSKLDEVLRVQCVELNKLIDHMSGHYDKVFNTIKSLNRKGKVVESMIKKYKPAELAEQICLWNQILFKNISSIEFLNQLWKDGEEKEFYSPNLTFFIQRFEKESYWVATEICCTQDLTKRISVLKRFILITKECLNRNNLFSVFSLLAGLNLTPVQRLKKTWAGLSATHKKMYQDLEKLSDPSKNMQNYRARSANSTPPLLPFIPIFLKDLIFFNDGNPNQISGGLVNIEKMRMITEQIKALTLMAYVSYKYTEDFAIQNYIRNPRVEPLKVLMEFSDKLEPRK